MHALSRSYQRGIEDLDYEVIVVENGSAPEQRLGEEFVRSFGPEFRYLDLGDDATPSPANALNRGIRGVARQRRSRLMIDGAHILTPGVLRYGMAGLTAYEPAIVATQQWYVGPGQQGDAMRAGYDEAYEDELFEQIAWPDDGYDLFEIGHFVADRDWFDGLWESNCLFVTRKLLEQVGGFDEGFAMAGGGYTNLDLYERLGVGARRPRRHDPRRGLVPPGARRHDDEPEPTRPNGASGCSGTTPTYAELRGRRFSGPAKVDPLRRRLHDRRREAVASAPDDRVDVPRRSRDRRRLDRATPLAVPDEIRDGFIDAYWRSGATERTTWLGQTLTNTPTDLFVYQEIIDEVRPDWIIETGTREGGRARFLASVCDLLGHGRIVSVGNGAHKNLPEHPRITYIVGQSTDDGDGRQGARARR